MMMVQAAVLSIGDEVVTGHVVDSNAAFLAGELTEAGVSVVRQVSVPDDHGLMVRVLQELGELVDVVVATGGLGPTRDDITREALAEVLGDEMVVDEEALLQMQARYAQHGRAFAERNAVQADRPASARCIDNEFGTAPGLVAEYVNKGEGDGVTKALRDRGHEGAVGLGVGRVRVSLMFFLPGVPCEMREMWNRSVRPMLAERYGEAFSEEGVVCVRYVQTVSFGESRIGELLGDVMARGRNPLVATLPGDSVVKVRIRSWGNDDDERGEGDAEAKAAAMEEEIASRLGRYVFSRGKTERALGEVVQGLMIEHGKTVAVAESCTAGLLGSLLTERSGSSAFFVGGWEVYTNKMKMKCLGVEEDLIAKYGAVSAECVEAMARGAIERSGSDYSIAITGIAGPCGGTDEKPVGTVFVGLGKRGGGGGGDDYEEDVGVVFKRFGFSGSRDQVRHRSAMAGMAMLYFDLMSGRDDVKGGEEAGGGGGGGKVAGLPRMLWEMSSGGGS